MNLDNFDNKIKKLSKSIKDFEFLAPTKQEQEVKKANETFNKTIKSIKIKKVSKVEKFFTGKKSGVKAIVDKKQKKTMDDCFAVVFKIYKELREFDNFRRLCEKYLNLMRHS